MTNYSKELSKNPGKCRKCGYEGDNFTASLATRICRPCNAKQQREYRQRKDKSYWQEKDRKYSLKKKYGLTPEDAEEFESTLKSRCAICRSKGYSINGKRPLAIDHCHDSGMVRGLLCNGCNRGLGFFDDSKIKLLRAWWYLELSDRIRNKESWEDLVEIGELLENEALEKHGELT